MHLGNMASFHRKVVNTFRDPNPPRPTESERIATRLTTNAPITNAPIAAGPASEGADCNRSSCGISQCHATILA